MGSAAIEDRRIHVVHIIGDLDAAGAQFSLYRLLSRSDGASFRHQVVSLTDEGPLASKIEGLGVPVQSLGMKRGRPNPAFLLRLARLLRAERPDVVQTWMYASDFIGGLAAKLAGGPPVVWGIHHSVLDPQTDKRMTRWTAWACARTSWWLPDRIIACSEAAFKLHARLGYKTDSMVTITNGFDLEVFLPDDGAKSDVRRELGLQRRAMLVGHVARFHPQKDHHNFIQAIGLVHRRVPEARFLLCGDGVDWQNEELVGWIEAAGVGDHTYLLGLRTDMPKITASLDMLALSSRQEAFPVVVGEAMACQVPCVVTDVGDASAIVGHTGSVVPPQDPDALAEAIADMIALSGDERTWLGEAARHRIKDKFSLQKTVSSYQNLYKEVTSGQSKLTRQV